MSIRGSMRHRRLWAELCPDRQRIQRLALWLRLRMVLGELALWLRKPRPPLFCLVWLLWTRERRKVPSWRLKNKHEVAPKHVSSRL